MFRRPVTADVEVNPRVSLCSPLPCLAPLCGWHHAGPRVPVALRGSADWTPPFCAGACTFTMPFFAISLGSLRSLLFPGTPSPCSESECGGHSIPAGKDLGGAGVGCQGEWGEQSADVYADVYAEVYANVYAEICADGSGVSLLAGLAHEHLASPQDSCFEPSSFISFL